MMLSKLPGSRSMTLEARAPVRRDSEKIDNENFMKYVQWVEREESSGGFKKGILPLHQPSGPSRRGLSSIFQIVTPRKCTARADCAAASAYSSSCDNK